MALCFSEHGKDNGAGSVHWSTLVHSDTKSSFLSQQCVVHNKKIYHAKRLAKIQVTRIRKAIMKYQNSSLEARYISICLCLPTVLFTQFKNKHDKTYIKGENDSLQLLNVLSFTVFVVCW